MPGLNKRSVLNMNSMQFNREYPTINFLKFSYFVQQDTVDISFLDANGYATNTAVNSICRWGVFNLPASANTTGPYVLTWTGEGTVWLENGSGAINEQAGSINYTKLANGQWSGTNAYIIMTLTGVTTNENSITIRTFNNANPITDIKFYFLADEADLTAGKVFRSGWKQTILDLNPGAIRCLNWTGGSANALVRWSDRIPPNYNNYTSSYRTLPYAASTGTADQAVAGVAGTPVAMRHGEIAQFKIGSTATSGAAVSITAITKAANGRVTATAHGFTTGMKIIHFINYGCTGTMWQLHYKVATITRFDADHYDLNINTSAFDVFNVVSYCVAMPNMTLNVGARGAYPVFRFQSEQPYTWFGNSWNANEWACCVFDKYLIGDVDVGAGVWRTFATSDTIFNPGCPVEVCTALVNELNAAKQIANPGSGAINLWLNVPYAGLLSVDPDYDANENLVVKTIDRCLNGDGGSWAGLTASAALLVEFSNETWNGVAGFDCATYLVRIGIDRYNVWPGGTAGGYADYNTFATTRAMALHQDVATAYPTELASSRVIRVMGGHAGSGPPSGSGSTNDIRIDGNADVLGDAWNTGNTAPYTKFEAFCWAPYTEPSAAVWASDYPTYKANYAAAVGAPAKETVCAGFVALIDATGELGNTYILGTLLPQTAAWMVARGKTTICYEGGYNWDTKPDFGTGSDVDGTLFLTGVQNSVAWAASQKACFNGFPTTTGAYHPAIYTEATDNRWGYNRPNFDTWLGGVEGAALNLTWAAMGEYNDANDSGTPSVIVMQPRIRLR